MTAEYGHQAPRRRRSGGRWYGGGNSYNGPVGKVQVEGRVRDAERRREPLTLPEPLLRLAQAEYDIQFPGQPYERTQERGGLGVLEVVCLLADALERERDRG